MSNLPDVSEIVLLQRETNELVPAELWDAITDKNLADWEHAWTPELLQRLLVLAKQGVAQKHWPQSFHWNWRDKAQSIKGLLDRQCFSVVCDDMTQAMMITDLSRRAQLESQKTDHLVYVDYVEAAPWNRSELSGVAPRYSMCGSVLINAAIQYSIMEGFKGRIGLHSLPQANGFYANHVGMTDLGLDADAHNLRYFEMTPEQAEEFIKKGG